MAFKQGIRIWRYEVPGGGSWQYHSKSQQRGDHSIPATSVTMPSGSNPPADGDFLFEAISTQTANLAAQTHIQQKDIFAHVPKRYVSDTTDIWFWEGSSQPGPDDGLSRIYVRRGDSEARSQRKEEQRAQIKAAMPAQAIEGLVVIPQDDKKVIYFARSGAPVEEILEVEEGQYQIPPPGSPEFNNGVFLAVMACSLNKNRKKLEKAFASAPDDPETAAQVVIEVIKGAAPAPTQGHNVAHSLTSVIDDIGKCQQVVSENVDSANVKGVTGDFGASFGAVDGTWQAMGSILSYMSDICHAAEVANTQTSLRQDHFGHNAKLRAWTGVGTSFSKACGTTYKTIDAFNQIATGASSLTVLAGSAAGAGGIVSCITMTRSFWQGHKASQREAALRRAGAIQGSKDVKMKNTTTELLAYAINKSKRKKRVKRSEGVIAGASTVSSGVLLAVAAGAAAANCWNPVGWGIGIAVFVAGSGMLIYKIYRKLKTKDIVRKDFPRLLVNRFLHLCAHHRPGGIRSGKTKDRRLVEIQVLEGMLLAYGVEPYRCLVPMEIPVLETRIARHLKS